ncbi:hypothetical protein D3C84_962540 [compost metagenome]
MSTPASVARAGKALAQARPRVNCKASVVRIGFMWGLIIIVGDAPKVRAIQISRSPPTGQGIGGHTGDLGGQIFVLLDPPGHANFVKQPVTKTPPNVLRNPPHADESHRPDL